MGWTTLRIDEKTKKLIDKKTTLSKKETYDKKLLQILKEINTPKKNLSKTDVREIVREEIKDIQRGY